MRSIGGMVLGAAGLVFVGSAVVFAATVVDAIRVNGVPMSSEPAIEMETPEDSGPVVVATQEALQGVIYPRVTNNEILDAVNQDLFQPTRTPPVERYLLPGERAAPVQNSGDNRRQREQNLRIVGTAMAGNLALAVVQLDDSIPFAVLLGEEVDGYVLAAVYEESVTLTEDGAEFTFPVVEPQRGSSSNNRDRNARANASTQEAARVLQERVQQMLQGMGRGQMQRGGGTTIDGVPIRIQLTGAGQVPTRGGRTGGGGGGGSLP